MQGGHREGVTMRLGFFLLAAVLFARPTDVKTVTLICQPGWRAGAGGQYGGVGFNVDCDNGRGTVKLRGVTGTAYSVRMGVESDTIAADCAFTGDAATVDETCAGAVRLTIQ
jgi:hypothetical protein